MKYFTALSGVTGAFPFLVATLCAVLGAGCASVSVKPVIVVPPEPPPHVPTKIYVQNFEALPPTFRVAQHAGDPGAAEREVQARLGARLVERLGKHIAPAQLAPAVPERSRDAWLVSGRFVRVNQGSRALRAIFGFGLGGSKMETRCEVRDLRAKSDRPFLVIETTGGSNAEPGALFQGDPITATLTLIYASTSTGITADASRTARMITAAISQYLAQRGAIPAQHALEPKPLGGLP